MSEKRSFLLTIQAGRGIAALLVVLYHVAGSTFASEKYWGIDPTNNAFNFGHAGVEFFFVLSGFIILYAHWKDIDQRKQLLSYIQKRFVRIYPFYWLVLAVIIPVYFIVPSFGQGNQRDVSVIISSITLLKLGSDSTILGVAWTLYHEVLFYFIFAITIWRKTVGFTLLAIWLLASALSLTMGELPYLMTFIFSPLHLLFGMGMGAYWLVRHGYVQLPWLFTTVGCALFFGVGVAENLGWAYNSYSAILYGIGSALAVAGLVTLEQQERVRIPTFFSLLGNASYAIYLIHFPLLSVLAKVFVRFGAKTYLPPLLSLILMTIIVLIIGIITHQMIERPLLKKIGSSLKPRLGIKKMPVV